MAKVIITKMDDRRYFGVSDAAKELGVARQTIYDYLNGKTTAIGPDKRRRLSVRKFSARR